MAGASNTLDKIFRLIPGYAGYAERQERRQSDSRLRTQVAATLENCEQVVETRLATALLNRDNEAVPAIEKCRKRLNTLASKVRFATVGQAGIMSDRPITDKELEEMMQLDLAIMETVSQLAERIEDLPTADVLTVMDRISLALEERNSFIEEFK